MSNKYLSPCRTIEICKGCILRRSCATKGGLPNCIKQFMDGLDIKEAVLKSGVSVDNNYVAAIKQLDKHSFDIECDDNVFVRLSEVLDCLKHLTVVQTKGIE